MLHLNMWWRRVLLWLDVEKDCLNKMMIETKYHYVAICYVTKLSDRDSWDLFFFGGDIGASLSRWISLIPT